VEWLGDIIVGPDL
jgi:hypothetical protein